MKRLRKYVDFTFSFTKTRYITGTGPLACWHVEDSSLVTTTSAVTKLMGWFAIL